MRVGIQDGKPVLLFLLRRHRLESLFPQVVEQGHAAPRSNVQFLFQLLLRLRICF